MFKKVIIIALVAMPLPCSAGNRWNDFCAFIGLGRHPVNPANHILGVPTDNFLKTTEIIVDAVKKPEVLEAAAEGVSHGTSHGFMRGLFTGPASAVRDGAIYAKDTAIEHPVLTTLAVAGAAYYKFRPLTEQEEQEAQIKKDKRIAEIRAAAAIIKEDDTADELRTCFNRHAYDNGSCDDKIKRCHSPARRLASYNRMRASSMTASFREYQ